jgi:hypothetical protein
MNKILKYIHTFGYMLQPNREIWQYFPPPKKKSWKNVATRKNLKDMFSLNQIAKF